MSSEESVCPYGPTETQNWTGSTNVSETSHYQISRTLSDLVLLHAATVTPEDTLEQTCVAKRRQKHKKYEESRVDSRTDRQRAVCLVRQCVKRKSRGATTNLERDMIRQGTEQKVEAS